MNAILNLRSVVSTTIRLLIAAGLVASACLAHAQTSPAITQQPASRTNMIGTTAAFVVEATGTPPMFLQWYFFDGSIFEGRAIPRATNATLTLPNVGLADTGQYWVTVSNTVGAVRSEEARLTVVPTVTGPGSLVLSYGARVAGLGAVYALAKEVDGRMVVGGYFTKINGVARTNLARLLPDGSVDPGFSPIVPLDRGTVQSIAVEPDGQIIIGGLFDTVNGTARNQLARLHPDGSLDETFAGPSTAFDVIYAVAVQSDGGILAAGYVGHDLSRVIRFRADGSPDPTFQVEAVGMNSIRAMVVQPDDKILVAGGFRSVNGVECLGIARLNPDGTLDASFAPGQGFRVDPIIYALGLQGDGRVLVGGYLQDSDGNVFHGMPLNADGAVDKTMAKVVVDGGSVEAIAIQADGKVIIGGSFWGVSGYQRYGIARLNPSGSVDENFDPGMGLGGYDGFGVRAIVIQEDGKAVIGGEFSTFDGILCNNIARLNSDETLPKITAQPAAQTRFSGQVATFRVLASGPEPLRFQWLFNGAPLLDATNALLTLHEVRSTNAGTYSVVVASGHASLTSSVAHLTVLPTPRGPGSLDISFDPTRSGETVGLEGSWSWSVSAGPLAVQPDGRTVVGSRFVGLNGTPCNNVVRINPDSSRDPSFNAGFGPDGEVQAIALQPDGKLLLAGTFQHVDGRRRPRLARLHSDGSLDVSFRAVEIGGAYPYLHSVASQADGKILVGGGFTRVNGLTITNLVRLQPDGFIDTAFRGPDFLADDNHSVFTVSILPTGKILVGSNGDADGRSLVRLHPDGSLDATFADPQIEDGSHRPGIVAVILPQPDGKILVRGSFQYVGGLPRRSLVRLHPDGALDPTFEALSVNDLVLALALQPDGKIVIGGWFTTVNSVERVGLARLNPDGTVDPGFDPGEAVCTDGRPRVRQVALLPDGQVLVAAESGPTNSLFCVGVNGRRDPHFSATLHMTEAFVRAISPQPDGKLVIGGVFSGLNGVFQPGLARMNPDGGLDPSFVPGSGPDGLSASIVLQPDGRLVLGGSFDHYDDVPRSGVARVLPDGQLDTSFDPGASGYGVECVALQSDGKILVGGRFSEFGGRPPGGLVRLHSNGNRDETFEPVNVIGGGDDDGVYTIALQPDGKIIVGGEFHADESRGIPQSNILRLNSDGSVDLGFQAESDRRVVAALVLGDGTLLIGGWV